MIAVHTIAYSLAAFFTYVYLELFFQLGVIATGLIAIYLFYHKFYILPLLLLSLNVYAFSTGQENLLHLTTALLVIHLLFSAPRQKILEKTINVLHEELKVVKEARSNGNDDKDGGSSSPDIISETITDSVTARSSLVDADKDQPNFSPPNKGSGSHNKNLIKRRTPKMSQADRDLIAAARLEAKKAEEERQKKYIEERILSPEKSKK